jgi:hypothetical protein
LALDDIIGNDQLRNRPLGALDDISWMASVLEVEAKTIELDLDLDITTRNKEPIHLGGGVSNEG